MAGLQTGASLAILRWKKDKEIEIHICRRGSRHSSDISHAGANHDVKVALPVRVVPHLQSVNQDGHEKN